ncbi:MAG TPA: hypothetical protein VNU27_06530 [Candidatus Acidoferrum sp.]|nr:hypothetical protein [Candidatus Angelobacter sp.]HXD81216.1 hypothetical protein [Candidatus Acidoferrum sp.]
MFGQSAGGFGLGLLAVLIGLAGVAAAVRTRRRRASYANTYGASGGIAFTIVQVGCSGLLLLGGIGLMTLAIIFQR